MIFIIPKLLKIIMSAKTIPIGVTIGTIIKIFPLIVLWYFEVKNNDVNYLISYYFELQSTKNLLEGKF